MVSLSRAPRNKRRAKTIASAIGTFQLDPKPADKFDSGFFASFKGVFKMSDSLFQVTGVSSGIAWDEIISKIVESGKKPAAQWQTRECDTSVLSRAVSPAWVSEAWVSAA
jgi:hypothetical protein